MYTIYNAIKEIKKAK